MKYLFLIFIVFFSGLQSFSQEKKNEAGFDFDKLKPIAQVFATANYNVNEQLYNYYFGRAHLGLQYNFNKAWSAKIIIDRGKPSRIGTFTVADSAGQQFIVSSDFREGAKYTMFLKFASLRWKATEKLTLETGALLQNHYITQERFWGFRYVAQTFQDLYWHLPSSDLGFIAFYKFNKTFAMDLALTNGEGPRFEQDDLGSVKLAGGLDIIPADNFSGRIYYHHKAATSNTGETEQMFSAFAGWRISFKSRVGIEFNLMDNLQNIDGLKSYGYSVYGAMSISPKMQVFGRFDRLLYELPENEVLTGFNNLSAIISGLSLNPVKGVSCSLNYQGFIPDGEDLNHGFNLSFEFKI
ncbi:MAG: hypothetical protein K9H16_14575 [Bacteroidales bacterium]|nr:hypothetical protein [Bacteroidales bacterium]